METVDYPGADLNRFPSRQTVSAARSLDKQEIYGSTAPPPATQEYPPAKKSDQSLLDIAFEEAMAIGQPEQVDQSARASLTSFVEENARSNQSTMPTLTSFEEENARSISRQRADRDKVTLATISKLKVKIVSPTGAEQPEEKKETESEKPTKPKPSRGAVAKQNQEEHEQKREILSK